MIIKFSEKLKKLQISNSLRFYQPQIFHRNFPPRLNLNFLSIITLLMLAVVWGIKLQFLEGFRYSSIRGFKGDFFEAMFGDVYWDGTGVFYGPIFTFEKKLVEQFPNFFSINLFAYFNIFLAAISFIAIIHSIKLFDNGKENVSKNARIKSTKPIALSLFLCAALALWLCSSPLYYSFSVAANPEFVMLSLLSLSYLFVQEKKLTLAYTLILLAVFTKVIPIIFICIFLLHPCRRAFRYTSILLVSVVITLSFVQKMTIFQTVTAILIPKANNQGKTLNLTSAYQPNPESGQSLGLNSAIARVCGESCKVSMDAIQNISFILMGTIYVLTVFVLMKTPKHKNAPHYSLDVTFQFSLLFALLPIISPSTHPHYFLFLLPSFVGVLSILFKDRNHARRVCFFILLFCVYLVQCIPYVYILLGEFFGLSLTSNLLLLDKAWTNLLYVLAILLYRVLWTKSLAREIS